MPSWGESEASTAGICLLLALLALLPLHQCLQARVVRLQLVRCCRQGGVAALCSFLACQHALAGPAQRALMNCCM